MHSEINTVHIASVPFLLVMSNFLFFSGGNRICCLVETVLLNGDKSESSFLIICGKKEDYVWNISIMTIIMLSISLKIAQNNSGILLLDS